MQFELFFFFTYLYCIQLKRKGGEKCNTYLLYTNDDDDNEDNLYENASFIPCQKNDNHNNNNLRTK